MNLAEEQGDGGLWHGAERSQPGLRDDENNFPRAQMVQGRVCCYPIVKELPGSKDVVDEERGCVQKPILFICP